MPHFDISVYFFNPNIQPLEEYHIRLRELHKLLDLFRTESSPLPLIEGEYYPSTWGICENCQELRINKTAELAAANRFDYFCSTLSISPHKSAELLNVLGAKAENTLRSSGSSVKWLPNDFKKRGGFLRSTEICREYQIYRQNYCGCLANKNVDKP